MDKPLNDMTLEELWELFPIVLVDYNPEWKHWAAEEIAFFETLFPAAAINHIGSTAIPGIKAKPIIDILIETDADFADVKRIMEAEGYICMSESDRRLSFNKGYTPAGYADKVFHIHVHRPGDHNEIIFRDYLLSHPDSARDYERLKQSLLPRFRNLRDPYTAAKTDFINSILSKTRQ